MYTIIEPSGESGGAIYPSLDTLRHVAEMHDAVQRGIARSVDAMTQAAEIARQYGQHDLAALIDQYITGQLTLLQTVDDAVLAAWPAAGSA